MSNRAPRGRRQVQQLNTELEQAKRVIALAESRIAALVSLAQKAKAELNDAEDHIATQTAVIDAYREEVAQLKESQ